VPGPEIFPTYAILSHPERNSSVYDWVSMARAPGSCPDIGMVNIAI
jgi:hypothetical protein